MLLCKSLGIYGALGTFKLLVIALLRHFHVLTGVCAQLIVLILPKLGLLSAAGHLARCKFTGLLLLRYPSLPLEWIDISDRCVANAHGGSAHLVLHALQPGLFFLLFRFLNILVQVLDIGGRLLLFSLRLFLTWVSLSLVL